MKNFETIETAAQAIELDHENITEAYNNIEAEMVETFGEFVIGAEVNSSAYGTGKVESYRGKTLDEMFVMIQFENELKCFSVNHIVTVARFIKFVDFEMNDNYNKLLAIHNELTAKKQAADRLSRQAAKEAAEKAEAEKKAEAKYQQQKEKALRDFDKLVARANNELSDVDEFYYALGYIAKHAGTVSAAMPDYLEDAFKKHFGSDTPCRVVDSKKKGPAGYTSQWTWSLGISLKKPETVPAFLHDKLNPAGKSITDTSFVWDLVDNYGFQFGKKQDIDKIKQTIPAIHLISFEAGLTA
jgi:hypothetical protein